MTEIRLHGRGGQGVVTGAEIIAIAAFHDKKYSQAFPYFGVERSGAPIESYARIDGSFINLREQVKEPNVVIIQDASLLGTVDVLAGLKDKGIILINTGKDLKEVFAGIGKVEKQSTAEECRSPLVPQDCGTRENAAGHKAGPWKVKTSPPPIRPAAELEGTGNSLQYGGQVFVRRGNSRFRVIAIDGTAIALKILGKPIVNTLMAYVLAKETDIISALSVEKALRQKFKSELLAKNLELGKSV